MTILTPLPHALPLRTDAAALGLRRIVVPTALGDVVVRTGRGAGGPATVMLHGAAGSWTTWTPLLAASDLHGASLTDVIALDLPGWGESDDAARVDSVEMLADAVVEVVRTLGYASWRIVGHSLGGFVALDIAARHPSATVDVTLVSASGAAVLDVMRRPVRNAVLLPWFLGMLLIMRTLAVLGGGALVGLMRRLGALPALAAPLFTTGVHPSVVAALGDEIRPRAFARAARLAAAYDENAWTAIRCPVRSVRGVHDVFAGEADAAVFVTMISNFRETRLVDAGHFAHIERPDAVLAALVADRSHTPHPSAMTAELVRRARTRPPARATAASTDGFGAAAEVRG